MSIRDALGRLFRRSRPEPDYGTATITPVVTMWMSQDDPTPEHEARAEAISWKLGEYQERMVAFHRSRLHWLYGIARLQHLTGTWDISSDRIRIVGSGDRFFVWEGAVEAFLKGGVPEVNNLLTEER
jgi:hypothetical protein